MRTPSNITLKIRIVAMFAIVVWHYILHTKYVSEFMIYILTEGHLTGSTASLVTVITSEAEENSCSVAILFYTLRKILDYFNWS